MSGDLRDLYQEMILDHGRHPRNAALPEGANREGRGYNPLCGDRITLGLRLDGDVIVDVGFEGSGCAISQASASTMTEAIKGKTVAEAEALFERFRDLVTGKDDDPDFEVLDKLAVFAGVAEFPARIKCATLAWHTLHQALDGGDSPAKTE